MNLSYIKYIFILIISAILLGLSFPFTGSMFVFSFVALIPLIDFNLSQRNTKFAGFKRFIGNYLYMITFNIWTTWWIANADFDGAVLAFVFNSLLMVLPLTFFNFFNKILGERKALLGLLVSWIAFEHIHHQWDLSWPWLSLGNVFGNHTSLIQWYEFSGIEGGTLWILLINFIIYYLYKNIFKLKESFKVQSPIIILLTLVLVFPILSSLWIGYNYEEKSNPVEIVIVQPNLDPWTQKFRIPDSKKVDLMLSSAEKLISEETQLVLFPETAFGYPGINENYLDNLGSTFKLRNFSAKYNNIGLLIGVDSYADFNNLRSFPAKKIKNIWRENYNSALLIDANNPIDTYHKAKLVLGAEKLPFIKYLPFLSKVSVELGGTSGMLVGNSTAKNFNNQNTKYAPLICYESVYGEYVTDFVKKGAQILCVITNDGWWGETPGYRQHLAFSRLRAVETRRSVIRSANTGISAFINQKGEVEQKLDWDVQESIKATVNKNDEITFFVIYGDLLGRVSEFMFIGLLLLAIQTYLKSRKTIIESK